MIIYRVHSIITIKHAVPLPDTGHEFYVILWFGQIGQIDRGNVMLYYAYDSQTVCKTDLRYHQSYGHTFHVEDT